MSRDLPGSAGNNISVADGGPSDVTGTVLTISVWMKPDSVSGSHHVLSKEVVTAGGTQYRMYYVGAGGVTFGIGDATTFDDSPAGATATVANVWQHFVGLKNGTGAGSIKVYKGGTQDASGTSTRTIQNTAHALKFGTRVTDDIPLDGKLAHIAMWNVALTDGEIGALSRGVSPLRVRPGPSLLGYWPLYGAAYPEIDLKGASNATQTGTVPAGADSPPVAMAR